MSLAILLAAWLVVRETAGRRAPGLDLGRAGMVSVALAALVIPLSEGRGLGWPGWVFGVLAAAPALIAWFLWHEDRLAARGGMPLLDLSLFRIESFRRGMLIATLFCFTASFYLLFRLSEQEGRGRDPLQTALAIVPYGIGLVFGPLAGALLQRFHARLLALGMLVQVTGSAALAVTAALALAGWPATLAVFVAGFGQGVAFPRLSTMARGDVPPHQAGLASGVINAGLQVGGAVSVAAIGTLFFALLGRAADERADAHAFSVAQAALTRAPFVAMLPAVPRRRKGAALDGATAT